MYFLFFFFISGCENKNIDNLNIEYKVGDRVELENTIVILNSVMGIDKECFFNNGDVCLSYIEPTNDYFLIVDLTIENKQDKDIGISSFINFELLDKSAERAVQQYYLNRLDNNVDGIIRANGKIIGQIAYDVKNSEYYNFYYIEDKTKGEKVKFVIDKKDIKIIDIQ